MKHSDPTSVPLLPPLHLLAAFLVCFVCVTPHALAQEEATAQNNPFTGDQTAVTLGKVTFEAQCATQCHPKEADWKGGKYPDLFDCEWVHGQDDAAVFKTVTEGVPKTEMLGWKGKLADDVIWKVIAYLRSASQCKESARQGSPVSLSSLATAH